MYPQNYLDILAKHGTVLQYGTDWEAYDFKATAAEFTKQNRPFKITEAKRLVYANDRVNFSDAYTGDFTEYSILKKGKSWSNFHPPRLAKCSTVKDAKKKDIFNLLTTIGASDDTVAFYRNLVSPVPVVESDDSDIE